MDEGYFIDETAWQREKGRVMEGRTDRKERGTPPGGGGELQSYGNDRQHFHPVILTTFRAGARRNLTEGFWDRITPQNTIIQLGAEIPPNRKQRAGAVSVPGGAASHAFCCVNTAA